MKEIIKITSKSRTELSSEVVIGRERYLVLTENISSKIPCITTRIYLKGELISSRKTEYKDIMGVPDIESKIQELMHRQHHMNINLFKTEKLKEAKTPSDYLEEAKNLLGRKNNKSALYVLNDALKQYPDDPFLLSYYGCLEAIVNKNYRDGISICKRAIEGLKLKVPFGEEFFYPVFYLNLGRAYLAGGKKKEAIDAFNKGIAMDRENSDLLWELKKLGMRRRPVVPFLQRSNPINKYIGMLLHKLRK
jgi:predicted Zn-dependent protease